MIWRRRRPDAPPAPTLLDERSDGGFRAAFARLSRGASEVRVAATRVRVNILDLQPSEMSDVRSLRVLLADLNGHRMALEADAVLADPLRRRTLGMLVRGLRAGRIEVRAAPMAGWSPDFSVFSREGRPAAALVGLHSFVRPSTVTGPQLLSIHGADAAARAAARFDEMWPAAHDAGPAILGLLTHAEARAPAVAAGADK